MLAHPGIEATMKRIWISRLQRFVKNEEGVTAVECALMLALVVVICLVALSPNSIAHEPPQSPAVVVDSE